MYVPSINVRYVIKIIHACYVVVNMHFLMLPQGSVSKNVYFKNVRNASMVLMFARNVFKDMLSMDGMVNVSLL